MIQANDLLNAYQLSRKAVYEAVEGLSQEHATWKPAEQAKSIQELVVHLGGAERFWLGTLGYEVLDFPTSDELSEAVAFAQGMEGIIAKQLKEATPEKLNEKVSTERGDLSLAWLVKRVNQHMFYHLGTLVYLRMIVEPDWEGEAGLSTWQKAVDTFSSLVETE